MVDFIVQLLSVVLLLTGLWLMGDKRLRGPFLACIAEVFVTIVGIQHQTWSIVVIGVCLGFVQGRNFLKWYRERTPW